MEWNKRLEFKNRNKMWFNMYKPSFEQYKILLKMVNYNKNYNKCKLLETKENDYTKLMKNNQLFILTHPTVEIIHKGKSVHIPIGYVHFKVAKEIFEDKNKKKYKIMYVSSRCSFALWPQVKNYITAISRIEKTKVNVGEILSLFLDNMARKLAYDNKTDHTLMINMSLSSAIYSHIKNGWSPFADIPLKKLKYKGISALDLMIDYFYYPSDDSTPTMYKLI